MLKITILAVGKLKKEYYKKAFDEYLKMIAPYASVKIEELAPEPFYDNSDKEKIKEKESLKIIKYLDKFPQTKVIVLDEGGKEFQSKMFSQFLFKNETEHIIFVIGGTLGFGREIFNYKNAIRISLSQMTFPHEMVRVILVEQIYRTIAINKNKSYHY
ncbi:MAG: hypothetical protein UR66_C0003G0138 [Candidatus Moranbacteria bacterium GW2011_GWE1_35_17]